MGIGRTPEQAEKDQAERSRVARAREEQRLRELRGGRGQLSERRAARGRKTGRK